MKILNVTRVDPNQYDKDDLNIIGLKEKEPDKWALGPWNFIINMNGVFTVWKNHKLVYQAPSSDHFDKIKFHPNGIEYNITIMDAPKMGISPKPSDPTGSVAGGPSYSYSRSCCGPTARNGKLVITKTGSGCTDTYGDLSGTYHTTLDDNGTYLFVINDSISFQFKCEGSGSPLTYKWYMYVLIDGVTQNDPVFFGTGNPPHFNGVSIAGGNCTYNFQVNSPDSKQDVTGAGAKTADGITGLATDPIVGVTIALAENTVSGGPTKSDLAWTDASIQKSDTLGNWVDAQPVTCDSGFSNYCQLSHGNVWITFWFWYPDPDGSTVNITIWLYDSTHGINSIVTVPISSGNHTATFSGSNYSFVATISTLMSISGGGGGE